MNSPIQKLIKELNISIFNENELVDKDVIVFFPGQFQPMGQHQREEYLRLSRKFGKDNVHVITDDKINPQKTPLSFEEKSSIIRRHGIKNIQKVLNPYMPTELINKLDPNNTILIFAVSSKNVSKLKNFKKITKYNGSSKLPIKDAQNPYVYYILTNEVKYDLPSFGRLNSTNIFRALSDREAKLSELKSRFISIFGWFDANLFNMIIKKFNTTRGELKDGKEELKPLQMVTRTFWNKVYESIVGDKNINEVATLPQTMLDEIEKIAKQFFHKIESEVKNDIDADNFDSKIRFNILDDMTELSTESTKIINDIIKSEPYVQELEKTNPNAFNNIKLHTFTVVVRPKRFVIDQTYDKFGKLIDLALDDEMPGTFTEKLNSFKKTEIWKDYELELKKLKNHNDFSVGSRAKFNSTGSIYKKDFKATLIVNFDWFLMYLKLLLVKNGFIQISLNKVVDDYVKGVYIGLVSHELIHFVQTIKQQIQTGERQASKYEFSSPDKLGYEKFNKMYLSDKAEIGAHAQQFVTDLKKAYPSKSADDLLKMFQSGKLPKKKFSPMYNYIGYYMKLLNKGKQDDTVKRFIKTVFLILKKD
jgi:hypothetical protein